MIIKKIISTVAAFTIAISAIPYSKTKTNATSKGNNINKQISVGSENSIGNLIGSDISDALTQEKDNTTNRVISIEMDGNEATVDYEIEHDCSLVVGIYSEDDEQLIVTGETNISADNNTVSFIVSDQVPDYYYIKAYLIDSETYRPLSQCYESDMYTKEIQELLNDTISDFDENKVINLDEDAQTNFVVLGDDIIQFDSSSANIISADDEKLVYSFENPDEKVSSISIGQIFVYNGNEGAVLIVKVADIEIKDNVITFYGEDTTAEEVFDYVKIEAECGMDEAEIEDTTLPDGVTLESQPLRHPKPIEGEMSSSKSLNVGIDMSVHVNKNLTVDLKGSLSFSKEVSLKYYLTLKKQFLEFKLSESFTVHFVISGELSIEIPLCALKFDFLKGTKYDLFVEIGSFFVIEASGAIEYSNTVESGIGFQIEHDGLKKPQSRNISPEPKFIKDNDKIEEMSFEGELFIGFKYAISLEPLKVFTDEKEWLEYVEKQKKKKWKVKTFSFNCSAKAGIKICASSNLKLKDDNAIHECEKCIEGEIRAVVEAKIEASLLELINIYADFDLIDLKLLDFHHSFDYDEFSFNKCPHYKYRITVKVYDDNNNPVANATVCAGDESFSTGADGRATFFSNRGSQTITASKDGYTFESVTIDVDQPMETGIQLRILSNVLYSGNDECTVFNYNGHSYNVFSGVANSIEDAMKYCEDRGGYLAVINNEYENDYIFRVMISQGYDNACFGYSDSEEEGHWNWLGNNEQSTYENWGQDEPNGGEAENTAMLWTAYRDGKWNDADFGAGNAFICEWDHENASTSIGIKTYNDHSYYVFSDICSSWEAAQEFCKQRGGYLAVINDAQENDAVFSIVKSSGYKSAYFGYTDAGEEGVWRWVDNDNSSYENWNKRTDIGDIEPSNGAKQDFDENYGMYYWKYPEGTWNDGDFNNTDDGGRAFICEWNSVNVDEKEKRIINTVKNKPLPSQKMYVSKNIDDNEEIKDLLVPEKNTVSYSNLIPNGIYNFYVMKSKSVESPLSNVNLLYINQLIADETGALSITYTPLNVYTNSEAFIVGMNGIDISDATIKVEDLLYNGNEQFADVRVALDDKELIEGLDYDICGDYIAKNCGQYNVRIIGRGAYEGNVSAEYSVINNETNSTTTTTTSTAITSITTTSTVYVTNITTGSTTSTTNSGSQPFTTSASTSTTTSTALVTSTTIRVTSTTTNSSSQPFTTTTATSTVTTVPATNTTSVTTTASTGTTNPVSYTLGDVNDDGKINAVDASTVLTYYANISTNKDGGFTDAQKKAADVNNDGVINAVDASCILSYYAYSSTTKEEIISMEDYMKKAA